VLRMASATMTRRSRVPFVILALVAVAALVGIVLFRNSSTSTPAPAAQALPAPITVPTKTATIAPFRHGWVTTPVGAKGAPRGVAEDWIEESYRAIAPKKLVAELDGRRADAG